MIICQHTSLTRKLHDRLLYHMKSELSLVEFTWFHLKAGCRWPSPHMLSHCLTLLKACFNQKDSRSSHPTPTPTTTQEQESGSPYISVVSGGKISFSTTYLFLKLNLKKESCLLCMWYLLCVSSHLLEVVYFWWDAGGCTHTCFVWTETTDFCTIK